MKLLFIGDVVGKGGREALINLVPKIKTDLNIQFVIANVENSAGGNGTTGKCLNELKNAVNVFTTGDHVWDQKGFESEIERYPECLRPANLSSKQPGRGFGIFRNPAGGDVAVINLLGKVFMKESAYCPFETVDRILNKEMPPHVKNIFVDFHAEATSEKLAMAYFLNGRVTAVFGTHTHVQTHDAKVLSDGTARITDAGMTGAAYSVLGRNVDDVIRKFNTGMPGRLNVVETGIIQLDGAVVDYNYTTGKALSITEVSYNFEVGN